MVNVRIQEADWGAHVLARREVLRSSLSAMWDDPSQRHISHSLREARNLSFTVKFLNLKYLAIQTNLNRSTSRTQSLPTGL